MTGWRQEAARAVEQERDHGWQAGAWSLLGPLTPLSEARWYVADLRGRRIGPDNLGELRVAGGGGPSRGAAVPVDEARLDRGVLRVRVGGPLPAECDRVWAATRSPYHLLGRLAGELRAGEGALADRLAAGELDPLPEPGPDTPELTGEQAVAYRACLEPGVRLVWTPPGTGGTHVLVAAAGELARTGGRVLVVSGVEGSVAEVAARVEGAVQVGITSPPLSEEDETVAELRAVQEDLTELDGSGDALAELDAALAGYDHAAFLDAGNRIANADRLAPLEADLAQAEERHEAAAWDLEAAQAGLRAARDEWERAAEARDHLARARSAADQLDLLDRRLHRQTTANAALDRLPRAERKALRAGTEEHDRLRAEVEACQAAARPYTEDDLRRLDDDLARAERALDDAARAETGAHTEAELLRRKIAQAHAAGVATEQDRRFHEACLRHGLPDRHRERERLRGRSRDEALRHRLTERLTWLADRAAEARHAAEATAVATAPVVVTTLARAYADDRLEGLRFDAVLVDDAATARLAEVLAAVSLANRTAVVFGDFARPGPIVRPPAIRTAPAVRTWLVGEPFGHCGVRTPDDAERHPGCAVLTAQYRFGGPLRTLLNELGYRVLRAAEPEPAATELVLVDASMLPGLAAVPIEDHAAGSWPAGALLASALADRHRDDFGVVAAHRAQAVASLAAVRDAGPRIGVGTAHACHGLDAAAVAFDLVGGVGWTRRSRARQFAAAVTRADRALYLLADLDTVRAAPEGSPLGAVNVLRTRGLLTVVGADDLLDLEPTEALAGYLAEAEESLWLSVPWIGGEDVDMLPPLAATARRGVDVRIVLPEQDHALARELAGCGATVHTGTAPPKVAVLDQRTVLFGSTHVRETDADREVLVACTGRRFARRLLTDLHTGDLRPVHGTWSARSENYAAG